MYVVVVEDEFSAAHRIDGHEKCGLLHGHNYKVVVRICCNRLVNDMAIDFGDVSQRLKLITDEFDHTLISFEDRKSTAEVIARVIFEKLQPMLQTHKNVWLHSVTVNETSKYGVEYYGSQG